MHVNYNYGFLGCCTI